MIRAALTVEEALEGMKALEPKIKNYARLVVRKGVNVKPGPSIKIKQAPSWARESSCMRFHSDVCSK